MGITAVVLIGASAFGGDLGLPTFVCGAAATGIVLLIERSHGRAVLRNVSWSLIPLVAGLFILVEGLNRSGVLPAVSAEPQATFWGGGIFSAVASNLINNLPKGWIAATTTQTT